MSESTDPSKTNPDPGKDPASDPTKGKDPDAKTFTQEDVDKVVSERLKREQEKTNKLIADKVAEAQAEAERKAKLSAEEKEAEERKRREVETANREREIILRENRADAREILQEKNISTELVDFVVDVDKDKTTENIGKLEKAYLKAVEAGVEAKLTGKTPEDKSTNNANPDTSHSGPFVL